MKHIQIQNTLKIKPMNSAFGLQENEKLYNLVYREICTLDNSVRMVRDELYMILNSYVNQINRKF